MIKERWKAFFLSLLAQDMTKQARLVEFLTVAVFCLMLLVGFALWQYPLELTAPRDGQRVTLARVNIFDLLLAKDRSR